MKNSMNRGSIWMVAGLTLAALVTMPAMAGAGEDSATASEIKKTIKSRYLATHETLKDVEGTVSEHGALEFWSSGGLMQWVPADGGVSEYEYFSVTPKHIKVIPIVEGQAATAMYYAEGGWKAKGASPVTHYMTRVMETYVKEGDAWVVRAAHWSPIAAGAGTNQTSLD